MDYRVLVAAGFEAAEKARRRFDAMRIYTIKYITLQGKKQHRIREHKKMDLDHREGCPSVLGDFLNRKNAAGALTTIRSWLQPHDGMADFRDTSL